MTTLMGPETAAIEASHSATRQRIDGIVRSFARMFVPLAFAFIFGAIVLAATGNSPLAIYGLLWNQAFGSLPNLDASFAAATPLLFTAIGAAFAYRAGIFSVGVEGSFVGGGLAAAVVGTHIGGLPGFIAILLPLVAGSVAGILVAVFPAFLRAAWDVDEVVTTLMMNFVVAGVANWLVVSYLQERGQGNTATKTMGGSSQLGHFGATALTNWGSVIGLVCLVAYWIFMYRTTAGFQFRAVGTAPKFALAQGIRVRWVIVTALLGAGLIGGLGGAVHASGDLLRFTGGFSASFGFTGIAIALIARFNPIGILVGSVIFGAINSAGTTAQLYVNLPIELVELLQGTVMIFAVATFGIPSWFRLYKARQESSGEKK